MSDDKNLEITEIEYSELSSIDFKNFRYGIRVKTTPQTYKQDFAQLVAEVKIRLHQLSEQARAEQPQHTKPKPKFKKK
jgi:hypothetical protein